MNSLTRILIPALLIAGTILTASAQTDDESAGSTVRRRTTAVDRNNRNQTDNGAPGVSQRMQQRMQPSNSVGEADMQWMRVIYRSLDLNNDRNAPLYFPEEPVDGQENLFRIIMRLMTAGQLPAYEYLDGREVFTDQYRVNVRDVLDRFQIYYTLAKGSTERNPKFTIEEADVPATEVLSYYVIERWEYDTRNNRLRPRVEAICPVLHRSGDFGGEAVKYPMFWIKYSDLRPWLASQTIFVSDDNNLPTCTYDDFFNLTMYDGEIYKTRNLKNKSMMQLYPDPDDLKRAQDSIQARLDGFEKKLWVPSREEVIAAREARERAEAGIPADSTEVAAAAAGDTGKAVRSTKRSSKKSSGTKSSTSKPAKPKEQKVKKPASSPSSSSSSNASRSVRRRK